MCNYNFPPVMISTRKVLVTSVFESPKKSRELAHKCAGKATPGGNERHVSVGNKACGMREEKKKKKTSLAL